jgi:hypothetical protein
LDRLRPQTEAASFIVTYANNSAPDGVNLTNAPTRPSKPVLHYGVVEPGAIFGGRAAFLEQKRRVDLFDVDAAVLEPTSSITSHLRIKRVAAKLKCQH